jgi:NADH:ubiquinone oxidoreductase subunit E
LELIVQTNQSLELLGCDIILEKTLTIEGGESMKVTLCMGSNCVMMGNMSIQTQLEDLKESLKWDALEIEFQQCQGQCKIDEATSPVVMIDGEEILSATSEVVMEKVMEGYRGEMPESEN